MSGEPVSDDEVLMRRVPPGSDWFEPPARLTSANFKLNKRQNEQGVSVYRRSILDEEEVLQKPEAKPGSFVVTATAGDIRNLTNAKGEHLRLDVVPVEDENNAGHAEIRGPNPGQLSRAVSKALRDLFAQSLR